MAAQSLVRKSIKYPLDTFSTNLQSCDDVFFINKEDKYFGYPVGDTTNLSNLDEREFSVKGKTKLGFS